MATLATNIANGQTTVTTAGTQVVLTTSTSIQSITIKALAGNTGLMYVGDSAVSSSVGFELSPGEAISLEVYDPSFIWIDSAVNGEGVSFITIA